ncbi:hypothetical protein EJ05DRAFT_499121 [Pseudovirgaria hyperparasitica]|uniref:UbiA prenyltransferase n=1 Tax=Pseudovirgaria hyperparasitica TaxID=470096 RepID=A0A6A6WD89_9PEZI|nr:uncharacterized protein EJ05DRAFT_499121 [Pseudovirgaria hyperparasitica]KAF2759930.1 hypothetical protein EJ05DRAFT_499121 [Pseudovirgaria hyperparasitica]
MVHKLRDLVQNFWLFTKDDAWTFVAPNTIFGLSSALAGRVFCNHSQSWQDTLLRAPLVVLFNWATLLIFDLANQRLPESVREDALNKPWRPVPSGRMSSEAVRMTMLACIPLVLILGNMLGAGPQCNGIIILTWLYNDLGGGDQNWALRNLIIAVAFGLFNVGSLRVAVGAGSEELELSYHGKMWTVMISAVIFTTMHVQDLKDQLGDKSRGRHTAPLILGDHYARYTIAIPVAVWSVIMSVYWNMRQWSLVLILLGSYISWRCLMLRNKEEDRKTWQFWAAWTAVLYILPTIFS